LTTELVCLTVTSRFYAQYRTIGLSKCQESCRSSVTNPYVMKPLLFFFTFCSYSLFTST